MDRLLIAVPNTVEKLVMKPFQQTDPSDEGEITPGNGLESDRPPSPPHEKQILETWENQFVRRNRRLLSVILK